MKNKTEQVEIMTKALISRCHGLYSQEALGNEIMDFADRVVKLLTTPDVSVSLVDAKFMKWLAKEAPELCESLYGCMHKYETNKR